MVALAEKSGLKRVFPALAVALIASAAAGCSETTNGTPKATAVAPVRSEFVDPGQPIVLSGASLAGSEAGTTSTVAAAGPAPTPAAQGTAPLPAKSPRIAAAQAPSAEPAQASTAIVEPSAADIVAPDPQTDTVMTLKDDTSSPPNPTASDQAPAEASADATISASAKAKLIGELKALKKRPGAEGSSTGTAECAVGSVDPYCIAAIQ